MRREECNLLDHHVIADVNGEECETLAEFLERRTNHIASIDHAIFADANAGQIASENALLHENGLHLAFFNLPLPSSFYPAIEHDVLTATECRLAIHAIAGCCLHVLVFVIESEGQIHRALISK